MEKDKAEVGRPKKTVDEAFENWPAWYADITELYMDGASDVEVKALIHYELGSFSNNLWDRWMEDEPEFWETIKRGRMLSHAWWEMNGRTNLKNKDFNYTGWYMNMKNRFSWKDRTDVTTDDKPIDVVQVEFVDYSKKDVDKS